MAWSTLDLGDGYGRLSVATFLPCKNAGIREVSSLQSGVAFIDGNSVVSSFHLHLAAYSAACRRDNRTLRYKDVHQELMMMLSVSRSTKKGLKDVSELEGSSTLDENGSECGDFSILASFDLDLEGQREISGN